ncbi:glycoside hydrolase [bacterium]|nr:glycoside hydrolase [bacterium]
MRKMCLLLLYLYVGSVAAAQSTNEYVESRETRPWVYWWWMGSAVDTDNLTRHLQLYQQAGFGGVHIIPIYGVRGEESRFIPFLSERWLAMLSHTVKEAGRLGLGVDMTVGTGWPYGGPWIQPQDAAKAWSVKRCASLQETKQSGERIIAVDSTGSAGYFVLLEKPTGMRVKRAAPGGEGWVIDYLSSRAVVNYLARFDSALSGYAGPMPRAFYHDSFEAAGCNGTDDFLAEFNNRRGYDFSRWLHAFYGAAEQETVGRVLCDFRETVSDLLLENFTRPWVQWSHGYKTVTRNQAHGSPGNLLDLYSAADIPETEVFGSSLLPIPGLRIDSTVFPQSGKPDLLVNKFASSAGHVAGKRLIASETCTWLAEHFKVSLSQVKPEVDRLFVAGINHIFFHGMTYSPADADYPGWIFYASTQFDPFNPFWRDLPELNRYISRCQAFLQQGQADPDVLLYFPLHDIWSSKSGQDGQLRLQVHNPDSWLYGTEFYNTAAWLQEQGYQFDYLSDRLLQTVVYSKGRLQTKGCQARMLVVPPCRYMPEKTMEKLCALIKTGATVVFCKHLPEDVPGLGRLEQRRAELKKSKEQIMRMGAKTDLAATLVEKSIQAEALAGKGLSYMRRVTGNQRIYFIANLSDHAVAEWIQPAAGSAAMTLYNPLTGFSGPASMDAQKKVFLSLKPGQSCILLTQTEKKPGPSPAPLRETDATFEIAGPWQVRFLDGEPRVQADSITVYALSSWTGWPLRNVKAFSGEVRYQTRFCKPDRAAAAWRLKLGAVCESARVFLNGKMIAACWSLPFECEIEDAALKTGENQLTIDVVNLAANRIADMDRRGVQWKKFYDINIVNTKYKPFNASTWPPMPSGLMGPVQLTALENIAD